MSEQHPDIGILAQTQIEQLSLPLKKSHVATRSQNGMDLSYIEAHHAIREANRIFGFDGWNRETLNITVVQAEQVDGKWRVSYTAQVKIAVRGGFEDHGHIQRVGTGFGQGIDKDLGKAHESAIKEAESDAMKRALMTFGDPFGLALYDKKQEHVDDEKPAKQEKPEVANARAWIVSRHGRNTEESHCGQGERNAERPDNRLLDHEGAESQQLCGGYGVARRE